MRKMLKIGTCLGLALMAFSTTSFASTYDYEGKWVLFGAENEYMFYCPVGYFDGSTTDVYGSDSAYFNAQPDLYHYIYSADSNSLPEGEESAQIGEEEVLARLAEEGMDASVQKQHGLTVITGRYEADEEDAEEGRYSAIDEIVIFQEGHPECILRHYYDVEEDTQELFNLVSDEILASVQPVQQEQNPIIGQYSIYKICYMGAEITVEPGNELGLDYIVTLAEDGDGYMWVNEEGQVIEDWKIVDGQLVIEDEAVGEFRDGDLWFGDEEVDIYLKKTNDLVILPYKNEVEEEPQEVHPYAWIGLEDMPQCEYVDLVASDHYYLEGDGYVTVMGMSLNYDAVQAIDGVDEYTVDYNGLTINVDGMIYNLNTDAKKYSATDMVSMTESLKKYREEERKNGIYSGNHEFVGTGKGQIPLYAETGDAAEYEYYEYVTDNSYDGNSNKKVERYYMSDGEVIATYVQTDAGSLSMEKTLVIKSISSEIPDGLLQKPDLTEYTEY